MDNGEIAMTITDTPNVLTELIELLSEAAVEIRNNDGTDNPVYRRLRAMIRRIEKVVNAEAQ
jgi:hypothetical protein